MTMASRSAVLAVAVAMGLLTGGCTTPSTGMSKTAYAATFSDVLRKSFAETANDNVCLPQLFGFGNVATDSTEVGLDTPGLAGIGTSRNAQLKALESVGLVVGVDSERSVAGKVQRFTTYRRTAKGEATFFNATFCYARVEFGSVVKWKGPVVLGDYRVAWVYYTTKAGHVADWARDAAIVAAFPTVKTFLTDPPKQRQVAIDLSSEGWDIAEYSKLLQMQ